MKRIFCLLLTAGVFSAGLFGLVPNFVQWKKIDTEHFSLVFPSEIEPEAQKAAANLERTYKDLNGSLGVDTTKYTIILSNFGVEPNGYVALAPKRSEWYGTPPQDSFSGPGGWFDLLASHETRHMAQFDAVNNGFVKFISIVAGQTGRSVVSNMALPGWVWEGDAVITETALSHAGRGRQSRFSQTLRMLALTDQHFNYQQALHRSYRRFYPNHYYLGYFLALHIRSEYGTDAWMKILKESGRLAFYPLVFESQVKRVTGKSISTLYEEAMTRWTADWRAQAESLELTPVIRKIPRQKWDRMSSYHPLGFLSDGSMAAVKSSLKDAPGIVAVRPDGSERRIAGAGSVDDQFDFHDGKIVFSERVADPVYSHRSYGEIVVVDGESGRRRILTRRSRYFAPSFSPDGSRLVVFYWGENMTGELRILDAKTGEVLRVLDNPDGSFLSQPRFSADGTRVYCFRQKTAGKALAEYDLASGRRRDLLDPSWTDMYDLEVAGDRLYFVSPYSGIDNVFAFDPGSGARYQVTSRPFGAAHPRVIDGSLWFGDYDEMGFGLASAELDSAGWIPWDRVQVWESESAVAAAALESGPVFPGPEGEPAELYSVKKTHPGAYGLNPHSWSLLPESLFALRAEISSEDVFQRWRIGASGTFDYRDLDGRGALSVEYRGLPLKVAVSGFGGEEHVAYASGDYVEENRTWYAGQKEADRHWGSFAYAGGSLGLALPLDLSRGLWYTDLSVSTRLDMVFNWDFKGPVSYDWTNYTDDWSYDLKMVHRAGFDNRYAMTAWDLYPRWRQAFSVDAYHDLMNPDRFALDGHAELAFPLWRGHSLRFQGRAFWNPEEHFAAPGLFLGGWGLGAPAADETPAVFADFGVNYLFPLAAPDWRIWHLVYIKRIYGQFFGGFRMNVEKYDSSFYDVDEFQWTLGTDIGMEFRLFNWSLPFFGGLRTGLRTTAEGKIQPFFAPLFGSSIPL